MDGSTHLWPIEELREHRDELCDSLQAEIDGGSEIWDLHGEVDDDLAEYNHAAVIQVVEQTIASVDFLDAVARELARLAVIRFPGDPELTHRPRKLPPVPAEPEVADPGAVERLSEEDGWAEHEIEEQYEDDVREAYRSATEDRAWHLRSLIEHAAELRYEISVVTRAGDEQEIDRLLAQRDELIQRLRSAATAWELALVAQMDGDAGGPSEHIGDVQTLAQRRPRRAVADWPRSHPRSTAAAQADVDRCPGVVPSRLPGSPRRAASRRAHSRAAGGRRGAVQTNTRTGPLGRRTLPAVVPPCTPDGR